MSRVHNICTSTRLHALQVDVLHIGQLSLKGVLQPMHVMTLAPLMLASRTFPQSLPGSKAKLVSAAQGLQCSVQLPADT